MPTISRGTSSFKGFRFIEKKNFCKHVVEKKFVASCNFGAWHHPKTVFFFFFLLIAEI